MTLTGSKAGWLRGRCVANRCVTAGCDSGANPAAERRQGQGREAHTGAQERDRKEGGRLTLER